MDLTRFFLQFVNPEVHSLIKPGKRTGYLKWFLHFSIIAILLQKTNAVELTFELPDNAKECFYEVIQEGKTSTVEFQVSSWLSSFWIYLSPHIRQ